MTYVVFDLETTSLNPVTGEILTGSFIKCDEEFNQAQILNLTFRPLVHKDFWDASAQNIHGISWEAAQDFTPAMESMAELDAFLEGVSTRCVFANYQQVQGKYYFDVAYLRSYYDNYFGFYSLNQKCQWQVSAHTLYKKIHSGPANLKAVCKALGIEQLSHHDAGDDARVTLEIFKQLGNDMAVKSFRRPMIDIKKIIDLEVVI